jgi:hypothetical protein
MEQIENNNRIGISKLKNDIKILSNEQIELKNQMKTVNLVGERTMEPERAQMKHWANRRKLTIMFTAYQIIRGKEVVKPKTLDTNPGEWYFYTEQAIDKIVNEYTIENKIAV